ncbi:MAG: glycoside hydrolase family 97 protein [Luteimonas sp.]|nr:glycoside hydrolase family 97 protein [Luteimonas sp.]
MPLAPRWSLSAVLALCCLPLSAATPESLELRSPGGNSVVTVAVGEGGVLEYAVAWNGQRILQPSPLGIRFDADDRILHGVRIAASRRSEGDTRYTLVAGKTSSAHDHYRELEVDVVDPRGRTLGVVLRAYDDGIAFRYRVPLPAEGDLEIKEDLSGFLFPDTLDCHALNLGRFGTSHEGEYDLIRSNVLRSHHLIELPLVCATGEGSTVFAIAEANLDRHAGMYLGGRDDGRHGVEARLSPRLDRSDIAVWLPRNDVPAEGHLSPWRVVMVGASHGALIESNLISHLNPPTPIVDTSWIKPGKSAWDWWSGSLAPDVPDAGMNNATMRRYIDHAAAMGLEYMLIDDGWYVGSTGNGRYNPDADILRAIPGIDLAMLEQYARERGVGLWLWTHWKSLDERMDEALAHYQQLGIKGIKVDFMDRDDQQMVDWYHRLMRRAADHRLMVNLHGAYRPTGLNRTWPNYLTQEGVLGAEYNKWSKRITPTHNLTLPFTRMLLGPMDYTPGGFRNVGVPDDFTPSFTAPLVMGTRAHQLAMLVVYESPMQVVADSPDAYLDEDGGMAPGADFIVAVPASWDETRVLSGAIGEYIVVARRQGDDWYIGAMTNEAARSVDVPLGFLAPGAYRATLWLDGDQPTDIRREQREIDPATATPLRLRLSPGGGATIRLSPSQAAMR